MPGVIGLIAGMVAAMATSAPCDLAAPFPVSREDQRVAIGSRLEIREDAQKTLTLDRVRGPEGCQGFAAPRTLTEVDLPGGPRYWVRFHPVFEEGSPHGWLLLLPFALYERVCVHWPLGDAGQETTCAGLGDPVSSRPIQHNRFVFPVPEGLDPGRSVLVEFESRAPLPFKAELVRAAAFISDDHRVQFLTGVFNGILLSTVLFNFILYFAVRDRATLLYALHLLSLCLAMLGFEGHGPELLWPWLGRWGASLPTFFLGTSFLFGCLYGRDFLLARQRASWLARGFLLAALPAIAVLPASVLNVTRAEQLSALAGLCFVGALGSAGVVLARKGDRPALYVLFGLSAFLAGTLVVSLRVLDMAAIPDAVGKALTRGGLVIASVAISLGLGRRIVDLRRERDRAEQAHAAAAQFAATIVDSAAEGIVAVDRDFRIQVVNPFLEDLLGLRAEDVIGRPATEVFPRWRDVLPGAQRVLGGETVSLEATQSVLGRRPWVAITLCPRRDPSGEVTGVIALVRDVTALKQAEDQHNRLEALLRSAAGEWRATFDAVDVIVVLLDGPGRIARLNRAAAELLGRDAAAEIGRALDEVGAGEPWAAAVRLLPRVDRSGATLDEIVRDAGTGKTWGISLSRLGSRGTPEERTVVVARDLTAVVHLEDSLRRKEHMSAMGSLVRSSP